MAVLVGARKQAKEGEGTETARRYGRDQLTVQSMFNLWIFGGQDRR